MAEQLSAERAAAGMCMELCDLYKYDREILAILTAARSGLEALAWNRYAARRTRESERRTFARRQRRLTARRRCRGGWRHV